MKMANQKLQSMEKIIMDNGLLSYPILMERILNWND
nr:MAG TPA: hypothetical protein [Caudoviricetes sp.]